MVDDLTRVFVGNWGEVHGPYRRRYSKNGSLTLRMPFDFSGLMQCVEGSTRSGLNRRPNFRIVRAKVQISNSAKKK